MPRQITDESDRWLSTAKLPRHSPQRAGEREARGVGDILKLENLTYTHPTSKSVSIPGAGFDYGQRLASVCPASLGCKVNSPSHQSNHPASSLDPCDQHSAALLLPMREQWREIPAFGLSAEQR